MNNFDCIVRNLNSAHFNWKDIKIPDKITGFEDLTFLFWSTPLNRGILRQDLDEAALLFWTIKTIDSALGVEIGRFSGGSTILLATAIGEKGKLISIDINPQDDIALQNILNKLGIADRVKLLIGNSKEIVAGDKYDFVFIDGDHSYEGAKKDHNKWGALVKVGGYIIHHDMGNERPFSTQWKELSMLRSDILIKQQKELIILKEAGSITIFQRIASSWGNL